MKKFITLLFLLSLISCIPDGARRTLGALEGDDDLTACSDLYFDLQDGNSCVSACTPTTQVVATSDEVSDLLNSESVSDGIKEIIKTAKGVCLEADIKEVRPSGELFIKGDFCVCRAGQSLSVNADSSCTTTCSAKTEEVAMLYGSVDVGALISGNEKLKNLYGFCKNSLDNDQLNNPNCEIQFTNGNNESVKIPLTVTSGSNRFSANLGSLAFDETYKYKIIETGTQIENATSDTKQLRIKEPDDTGDVNLEDNLHLTLVNQYTCLLRTVSVNEATSQNFYIDYARYHYYQQSTASILPLAPGAATRIFCHDYVTTGSKNDNVAFPRLENIPGHFTVWDNQDPRFIKDGTNYKVEHLVREKLVKMGYPTATTKSYFGTISTCVAPDTADNICVGPDILGYAMTPFINTAGKSFCPGLNEYNDQTKPEFVALGEIIGVATEGLYFAEGPREVVTITANDGTSSETEIARDLILIRENILKKIWFHLSSNGLPYAPTSSTERQATYFYWPPNYDTPYVQQKGFQKLYTVKGSNEIGSNGRTTTEATSIIPHDRKSFCVPATSN